MTDHSARKAIADLTREVAGIVIAIKTPAMFDAAHYDRVIKALKDICERIER